MRKIAALLLVLSLGGCTAYDVTAIVDTFAPTTSKQIAKVYCTRIDSMYREAIALGAAYASGQCRAIVRTQAIVNATRAVCRNVDKMTATQLYSTVVQVREQWKSASTAVVGGC